MASSPAKLSLSIFGPACRLAVALWSRTPMSFPRSTIPNRTTCTARLSLWFLDLALANFMSFRIVCLMKDLRDADVVRGKRGNRVRWSLLNLRSAVGVRGKDKCSYELHGRNHIFLFQQNVRLNQSLADFSGERPITFHEQRRYIRRKIRRLSWITLRHLSGIPGVMSRRKTTTAITYLAYEID